MNVVDTEIEDLKIIEPRVFADARGFFMETWSRRAYSQVGIDCDFVQDNHSRSARGTLRGLHYQIEHPQGKLIRIVVGAAFDVAVDFRASSPTFGRWVGTVLTAENKRQLWIPPGFAHGFLSLADGTELIYKCSDFYDVTSERCVRWDDPAIGIRWPLEGIGEPILSAKDAAGKPLAEVEVFP